MLRASWSESWLSVGWRAQAKAAAEEAKYKARVAQRRDYMLFSFFVLPAAVILLVAWQTGYLASLDTHQHF